MSNNFGNRAGARGQFFRLSPCLTETTLSSQVSTLLLLLDQLETQSWLIDVRYKKQQIWHGYKLGECLQIGLMRKGAGAGIAQSA